ncbi:Gustatory receptor 37 [Frankliniella occidentalis]|uniref:Gustatory receptor 5a for trehalose-like n=1 Tax=Frankliniella occidentalis TaxID=133901 RepID=A0A9C6X989_FRAOC|nr:gustatory receptor 5a for trehalose-like [Frankliniella occidentalis]KAE8737858.1 Gustatory receptor 37 [Frankliniella occidentalis]
MSTTGSARRGTWRFGSVHNLPALSGPEAPGGGPGAHAGVPEQGRTRAWTLPTKPVAVVPSRGLLLAVGPRLQGLQDASDQLKDDRDEGSAILRALRPALTVAQVFGLLPVSKPSDARHAVFRWKSARTALAVTIIVGAVLESMLALMRMVETGIKYSTSVHAIFFVVTSVGQMLFLHMSGQWHGLLVDLARVDGTCQRAYGEPGRLRARTLAVTVVALSLAAVEHTLSMLGSLYFVWPCYQRGGILFVWQGYFLTKYLKTFTVTAFATWKATLLLLLQFINVFVWNFMDLFVALFAMGLSSRFRQVNAELQATKTEVLSSEFWKSKRKLYNELADLVRRVDDVIGPLILVSYATDLYFICLQLLSLVNPSGVSVYHQAFFSFSMGYLILRMTFMTHAAANIHEESRGPKEVLFALPTGAYSVEAERFLMQVLTDNVAFTGCNFFSISRSFLLKVAGTIVTYAVVLVQFNSKEANPDAAQSNGTILCTCEDISRDYKC